MKVGDLVQIQHDHPNMAHLGESRYIGMRGVVIEAHPHGGLDPDMDVMWESGDIEGMYTQDLQVCNESR